MKSPRCSNPVGLLLCVMPSGHRGVCVGFREWQCVGTTEDQAKCQVTAADKCACRSTKPRAEDWCSECREYHAPASPANRGEQ